MGQVLFSEATPAMKRRKYIRGVQAQLRALDVPLRPSQNMMIEPKPEPEPEAFEPPPPLPPIKYVLGYTKATGTWAFVEANKAPEIPKPPADLCIPQATVEKIMYAVGKYYNYRVSLIKGQRRNAPLAYVRHIAMYLADRLTDHSTIAIGSRMGNRDHTTIIYGVRKIERLRLSDSKLDAELTELEREIAAG